YLLYPRVFPDYAAHLGKYSDTSVLPTPVFFYGMEPGEEISVHIEKGKTLILKFQTVGDPHPDGNRLVFFELNGQPREGLGVDRRAGGGRGGARGAGRRGAEAPEGGGEQPAARRRADAGAGGDRGGGAGRGGGQGAEAAHAGGDEDGDDAVRRAGRPHRRRAGAAGDAGRGRRPVAAVRGIGRGIHSRRGNHPLAPCCRNRALIRSFLVKFAAKYSGDRRILPVR